MKLLFSPNFTRATKRLLKKNSKLNRSLKETLKTLEADMFHPILKTHMLKGKFKGRWACSAGYDLRIIFKIVPLDDTETILLLTIGTHDEVY